MHYIAAFHPAEEKAGAFTVTFPDLPGCITQGDTFTEAFAMAQEALEGFLDVMREDNDIIPEPSGFEEAMAKARAEAEEDGEPLAPGTIFQAVPVPPLDVPPVRFNVSMAPHVLYRIDRFAKAEGLTRSGFLANAARHYIKDLASEDAKDCPPAAH
ncbi:putative protein family UPF0150 [Desulfovibrio sp. X2]|uniref:type II toxin-antitoxin system HicB family antitoxin n=1 Tax=Desulfovibrio sp. X2 TaxID=941449 RepID=UPI000358ED53|nr:type II toxin-antitoxin system HicB family antitoxin [Desulfovibrio sp. X2]EPR43124.1 putative protein family UPF0150 [Desulfovibrio sp. X2]